MRRLGRYFMSGPSAFRRDDEEPAQTERLGKPDRLSKKLRDRPRLAP